MFSSEGVTISGDAKKNNYSVSTLFSPSWVRFTVEVLLAILMRTGVKVTSQPHAKWSIS